MEQELLIPGMQDGEKTNLGAQTAWVGRNGEQRFGNRAEQDAVNRLWILKRDHHEIVGQGEDEMAIRNGQEIMLFESEPFLAGCGLAFRAMPVTARLKLYGLMRAVIALFNACSERGSLACADVPEYP